MAKPKLGQLLDDALAAKSDNNYDRLDTALVKILTHHLDNLGVKVSLVTSRTHDWNSEYALLRITVLGETFTIPVPELKFLNSELAEKVKQNMEKKSETLIGLYAKVYNVVEVFLSTRPEDGYWLSRLEEAVIALEIETARFDNTAREAVRQHFAQSDVHAQRRFPLWFDEPGKYRHLVDFRRLIFRAGHISSVIQQAALSLGHAKLWDSGLKAVVANLNQIRSEKPNFVDPATVRIGTSDAELQSLVREAIALPKKIKSAGQQIGRKPTQRMVEIWINRFEQNYPLS